MTNDEKVTIKDEIDHTTLNQKEDKEHSNQDEIEDIHSECGQNGNSVNLSEMTGNNSSKLKNGKWSSEEVRQILFYFKRIKN